MDSNKNQPGENMLTKAIFGQMSVWEKAIFLVQRTRRSINKEQILGMASKILAPQKFVNLIKPATEADGVIVLTPSDIEKKAKLFDENENGFTKFVPMSGKASRMFKTLVEVHQGSTKEADLKFVEKFIEGLDKETKGPKFAFRFILRGMLKKDGHDMYHLIVKKDYQTILEYVLYEKGLNYSNLPKGLIHFHINQENSPVLALEEHMIEARRDTHGRLAITIDEEHLPLFNKAIKEIKNRNVILKNVEVTISYQSPSTDSIAFDAVTKKLVVDSKGAVEFFKAGHGALVPNIKEPSVVVNVDNVPLPMADRDIRRNVFRAFAVILSEVKKEIYDLANRIEKNLIMQSKEIDTVLERLKQKGVQLHLNLDNFKNLDFEAKKEVALKALRRPIKLIGVVENQGEPGGGPFVIEYNGVQIISIVEKDEISKEQKPMMVDGKFFNPVWLMDDNTDDQGNPYDLNQFVNHARFFLVKKGHKGGEVLRMELPGLWNGGMEGHTSIFIAVPIEVFAPVKNINDLLGEKHQPEVEAAHSSSDSNPDGSNEDSSEEENKEEEG